MNNMAIWIPILFGMYFAIIWKFFTFVFHVTLQCPVSENDPYTNVCVHICICVCVNKEPYIVCTKYYICVNCNIYSFLFVSVDKIMPLSSHRVSQYQRNLNLAIFYSRYYFVLSRSLLFFSVTLD